MRRMSLTLVLCFLIVCSMIIPVSLGLDVKTTHQQPSIFGNGNTLYVGGNGPNNYTKIQDAINDANNGDTVFVYDNSSPYFESIIIDKTINLLGENVDTTIINAQGSSFALKIDANNILVTGFTLINAESGVFAGPSGINCLIQNNKIMYNREGIKIENYKDITDYFFDSNFICHNEWTGIWDDKRDGIMYYTNNIIADNSYFGWGQTNYAFWKHISGSVFHHNDVFLNYRNVICECPTQQSNKWNNETSGNYWDDWEQNIGYPDTYIIPCTNDIDQIDYKPKATPYFNCLVVSIPGNIYSSLNEPAYFSANSNVEASDLIWFWEFGDGQTSDERNPQHSYATTGRYSVNVTVTDLEGRTDMSKTTAIIGSPPYAPNIDGPRSGVVGISYTFNFTAIDPDSDDLIYHIYWGDMFLEDAGPYPSGQKFSLKHTWIHEDTYSINVYVEDTSGLYSPDVFFEVTIPRNKVAVKSYWQGFLDMFPIFERLFEYLNLN